MSGWLEGGNEVLGASDCWDLLRSTRIGRVAIPSLLLPAILPVRHYVDGSDLVICLGRHRVSAEALRDCIVGFAADALHPESGAVWSVQVKGIGRIQDAHGVRTNCVHPASGQVLHLSPLTVSGLRVDLCPFESTFNELALRFENPAAVVGSVLAASPVPHNFSPEADVGFVVRGKSTDVETDVLVVDFADGLRETTAEVLRSRGAVVAEADSAERAEEILDRETVRLMVLEPDLPLRSGVELVESLYDPPPVVVFSSHPVQCRDRDRMDGKVVCYLQKPVAPRELIAVVQKVLG